MRNGISRRHWLTGTFAALCGWLVGRTPAAAASHPVPCTSVHPHDALTFHSDASFIYESNSPYMASDSFTYVSPDCRSEPES